MDAKPKNEPPSWSLWTSLSYAMVMVLIGIPLWWKTTTVQRAPLPYQEMLMLHEFLTNNFRIQVDVHFKGFSITEDVALENTAYFKYNFIPMADSEKEVMKKSKDLYEVDKSLCSLSPRNELNIYYVDRVEFRKEYGQRIVVGNCNSIYYLSNSAPPNFEIITSILNNFKPSSNDNSSELNLPLSIGYDVLLSLLVPEPEVFDVTWKIQYGIKKYIEPMLQKLNNFAEFNIRSQILYYIRLNVRPKFNKDTGNYEVSYDQLPIVINPVESKLTSFVSQNPALNFLVYVAPCSSSPMQIMEEDGSFIDSNGFFVPQWGGIQVYNEPCSSSSNDTTPHEVSIRSIMSVIIPQFRALIGVPRLTGDVAVLDLRGSALRDWEVDILLRRRLEHLLFTSANTLMSLGNLLDQITNIVVTEEVGEEVEQSVNTLKLSYNEAKEGNLEKALRYAITSYKSSEIAFHHPSNLAQLYFPDDQKYAIYIPLFLPVGIPVLLSLRSIFQILKNRRKKNELEKSKSE